MTGNATGKRKKDVVLLLKGHRIVIPAEVDPVRQALLGTLDEVEEYDPLWTEDEEQEMIRSPVGQDGPRHAENSDRGEARAIDKHRSSTPPGPGKGASENAPPIATDPRSTDTKSRTYESSRRRPIRISGGSLARNADLAEARLVEAKIGIYRRGSKLVRPIVDEVPARDGGKTKTAALTDVSETYLRDQLCKHIPWQKRDSRGSRWRNVNPPREVAQTILARAGEWRFPALTGIIQTPVMLRDGSVLSKPGYNEKTGLMLFHPPSMLPIPEHPSQDAAQAALKRLEGLLEEFPFVDAPSKSVALSALITPAVRAALTAAPMHVFTSPTPGTGKSYLVDVVSAIYTGAPCPVIGRGDTHGELEKRLNASLIAGHSLINIDNVNGELGGDFLCQAIERPTQDIRVLGKGEHVRVHNNALLFATGNNLRLVADLIRRSVVCTFDAGVERPELRLFKADPLKEVVARRGEVIAAVLTIVRAYRVARENGLAGPSQLGSFPEWSDFVRGPLIWLGRADPLMTMETARDLDPELAVLRTVLAAIVREFGHGAASAQITAQIVTRARNSPELQSALKEISLKGDPVDPVSLGRWLARYQNRIVGKHKLIRIPKGKRPAEWYVEMLSTD